MMFWERPVWDCLVPEALREMDRPIPNDDFTVTSAGNSLSGTTLSSLTEAYSKRTSYEEWLSEKKETALRLSEKKETALRLSEKKETALTKEQTKAASPDNDSVTSYAWSHFSFSPSQKKSEELSLEKNVEQSAAVKTVVQTKTATPDNATAASKSYTWSSFAFLFGKAQEEEEQEEELVTVLLPPPVFFDIYDIPHPPSEGHAACDDSWLPRSPSLVYEYPLIAKSDHCEVIKISEKVQ
jgi:hypothetical protein